MEKTFNEMSGKRIFFVKNDLADLLISEICPVGKEIEKLMKMRHIYLKFLKKGSEKARIKAEENLKKYVKKLV